MQHIKVHAEDGSEQMVVVTKEGKSSNEVVPEPVYDEEGNVVEQAPVAVQSSDFTYIDRAKNIKFSFNPLTLEARFDAADAYIDEEYQVPENFFNLKNELVQQLNKYISTQYRSGTTYISVGANPQQIVVNISCHNINFKNFWGGEWLSKWTIDLAAGKMVGWIRVHNHYFESGGNI